MHRSTFCARLDDRLRTDEFAEVDASANGLQIGTLDGEVAHAAFSVDAATETIDAAADAGADILVVHHGLSWGGLDRVTGRTYRRIEKLARNDIGLYVSHLPLDGHPELGNAAGIADLLGLTDREPFGALGPVHIGQRGTAEEPFGPGELSALLERELATGGRSVRVLDFGPDRIEDVAVLTGSGVDWLDEAVDTGADALVTGEGKGKAYHEAREAGITVVLAGHYATETFGVRALQELAEGWGLETTFVDAPTGL